MDRSYVQALLLIFVFCFGDIMNVCSSPLDEQIPEQIHTSLTGIDSELGISYVTEDPDNVEITSNVWYGTDIQQLDKKAQGYSYKYGTEGHDFRIHYVKLEDLELNLKYYYKVGDSKYGWSKIFNFTRKTEKLVYAVYGDMGHSNAVSLPQLIKEVNHNVFDMVLHAGDFAYDFYEKDGSTGDAFMNDIQNIAAYVPYMPAPGNHEKKYNFSHYVHRFSNVNETGKNSGSDTNLWYSFDVGNIHFIAFDSEVYYYYSDPGQIQRQLNWLEQDLIMANKNREKTPWIITFAHKGWFHDKTNFTEFSILQHKYGVDLHFCGHSHNYQRYFPNYDGKMIDFPEDKNMYINPKYLTTVVSGAAGCKERISSGKGPEKALVKFIMDYGIGHMQVVNRTHLWWKWENTNKTGTPVMDEFWLIQENHGPRSFDDIYV